MIFSALSLKQALMNPKALVSTCPVQAEVRMGIAVKCFGTPEGVSSARRSSQILGS
jgi:hypothetical protein